MRHEKKLLAVPVPDCPDLPQKENEKNGQYGTLFHIRYAAEVLTVDGEEVLAVTTFYTDGTPCRRFWQAGEQYGMEVFRKQEYDYHNYRKPGKMYGAAIDSIYEDFGRYYSRDKTNFYAPDESADAVLRFIGKPDEEREKAFDLLVDYQRTGREKIIERRDERKRALIREAFRGIRPGAPEGFKEWCEAVPMADCRYFFYTYTGKTEQEGICSYCGKTSSMAGIRDRKMGTCSACGSRVKFWSLRRLNRSHGISHRIDAAVYQTVNGRIVARKFEVGIFLKGAGYGIKKEMWARETKRSFLDGKTAVEVERYATPTGTTKVYVDGLCRDSAYDNFGTCAVAPVNIREIRESLGLYAPLEALAEHGREMDPVTVWNQARKKPEVEYLIKLGLYRLAENELLGAYGVNDVLKRDKRSAAELLGVPKDAVSMLRSVDPTAKALVMIRGLIKCGTALKEQDMRDINEMGLSWGMIRQLQTLMQYLSIHKSLRYIRKQMEHCSAFENAAHVLQTWDDYMSMAFRAGKNIDDIHVALPKHLKAAHDETAKILRMQKDKELNEAVGKSAKKLRDLCWTWNGLTIRPAESQEELFQEGETLNHCVGRMGYAEKMAKFQTAIFFIRKEQAPDVPYVTLELDLKKWDKLQCYGKGDTWAGKLVDSFVKKWIKDIVKPAKCKGQAKTA